MQYVQSMSIDMYTNNSIAMFYVGKTLQLVWDSLGTILVTKVPSSFYSFIYFVLVLNLSAIR
jgi:hypothetical protein